MIHVLIERTIAPDMETTYDHVARSTLHSAYEAPGFINGETFTDLQTPKTRYVMSKWRSVQDWQHWYNSKARRDMMSEMNLVLATPEKINLLQN